MKTSHSAVLINMNFRKCVYHQDYIITEVITENRDPTRFTTMMNVR